MDSNKSKRVVVYCRVATQTQLAGDHKLEAQSADCMSRPSGWVMKSWEKSASTKKEPRLTATVGKELVRRRWSKRRIFSLLPILHG